MVEVILQAAAHILEDDISAFTTNHIAQRAGVSIGSVYQYFPNADAIMAALIEAHVTEEREAANRILQSRSQSKTDILRKLVIAFVSAHSAAPRLTAQLHALAPSFGLQEHLTNSRNEQAAQIARALQLPEPATKISAMAVEGVVLAMLANDPEQLNSNCFVEQLYAIAIAPLTVNSPLLENK